MARGRTQSGLIIQTGLSAQEDHPLLCRICGARFTMHETSGYQRHVVACAKANEEHLQKLSAAHQAKELGADKELENWVDDHRIEIIEGRKSIYGEDRGHWRKGME
jgi:uncharacterized protein YhfF